MQIKNIQSTEQLFVLAEKVHEFLKREVHTDDIECAVQRGHELAAYMANTGKMLADSKYHRDKAYSDSTLTKLKERQLTGLSATTMNKLIDADCKDFNYLVNLIEQLDKECKHQLTWLITCVSKAKEEMRLSQFSNQNA